MSTQVMRDFLSTIKESNRFLNTVQNLSKLKPGQLNKLNIEINRSKLVKNNKIGIF